MKLIDIKKLKIDSSYYVVPMYYKKYFLKANKIENSLLYWYASDNRKKLLLTEKEIIKINELLHEEVFKTKFNKMINEKD